MANTDTVPERVAPEMGEVIEATGGMVSTAGVTKTAVCAVTVPALLVAVKV